MKLVCTVVVVTSPPRTTTGHLTLRDWIKGEATTYFAQIVLENSLVFWQKPDILHSCFFVFRSEWRRRLWSPGLQTNNIQTASKLRVPEVIHRIRRAGLHVREIVQCSSDFRQIGVEPPTGNFSIPQRSLRMSVFLF